MSMRYTLSEKEINITVDLLLNKYEISTQLLNDLYGRRHKSDTEAILSELQHSELDKKNLCRLSVISEGVNLFAGSSESKRKLRKKILDKMPDTLVEQLYYKYPDTSKNITSASYMRKPLADKKWYAGKRWANDFIEAAGFPKILAGIATDRTEIKRSVEIIEPRKRVPKLEDYQVDIKEKLLSILKRQEDKTRCMISLPTGGGKTRVAVEAFLEWMQYRFDENKFMIWIAQSEELCEQCISCIEELWKDREFVLPLKVYRYFSKYDFPDDDELSGGVIVAGINKLYYNINDEKVAYILKNTGAMIIDEAHRAITHMYDELLRKAKELTGGSLFPICGLTATPGRNTLIGDSEVNKLVDMFQMNLITPIFSEDKKYKDNPIDYFKERQFLARVNHIVINSGIEYRLTEEEVKELEEKNEYAPSFLKTLANDTRRNLLIVKRLLKIKRGQPTLVYACTVEHAIFLSTIMNALGRKSASINSDTNKTERRIIINEFKNGKIDFLFNYGVLTTGFDAPKTRNIVICRPINSNILYEQIIGRGIRGIKFGGTEECDVIDFSDNIHNFGEQKAFMRFKEYWDREREES